MTGGLNYMHELGLVHGDIKSVRVVHGVYYGQPTHFPPHTV